MSFEDELERATEMADPAGVEWILGVEDRVQTMERIALVAIALAIVALSFALVAFLAAVW